MGGSCIDFSDSARQNINFLKDLNIDSQEAPKPLPVFASTKKGNGQPYWGLFYHCVGCLNFPLFSEFKFKNSQQKKFGVFFSKPGKQLLPDFRTTNRNRFNLEHINPILAVKKWISTKWKTPERSR